MAYLCVGIFEGPNHKVLNLTGDPEKLQSAAVDDGMHLIECLKVVRYLELMFQCCKSRTGYLVASPADIRFLPQLDSAGIARREAVLAYYSQELHPLNAAAISQGFTSEYFYIEDRQLLSSRVTMQSNGIFSEEITVLEADLPVVWVH